MVIGDKRSEDATAAATTAAEATTALGRPDNCAAVRRHRQFSRPGIAAWSAVAESFPRFAPVLRFQRGPLGSHRPTVFFVQEIDAVDLAGRLG